MGRAVLKTLKQTTLLTFFDICSAWGLKPKRDYEYNSNDGRLKFANGSEIYLKDLAFYPADPEYDSLGSTEYTGAFIDEASQIKNKAKNIVMSRLRYRLDEFGLVPKLLIASNPSKNFLYKEFYKPWKEKKLENYRSFIPSLVQDNPFISQHYITNLHKLDPVSKQRLLYGNFDYDDDPARLFDYDDIMDLFTNMPEKRDKKYLTVDVARKGKDLTTMFYWEGLLVRGIWAYQYENREHPFSGIQTIHGNSTQQTLKILQEKCETLHIQRSHVVIDEDGVGCLTKDTEIFTIDGWIKIQDVQQNMRLYSKNQKGEVTIEQVNSIRINEPIKIIEAKNGYSFSYCHATPVKTRKEYQLKNEFWDSIIQKKFVYLDNDFRWNGESKRFILPATKYMMPHGGVKCLDNPIDISSKDIAGFLGWFLSEGCIDQKYIRIIQSEKSTKNNDIQEAIRRVGLSCHIKYRKGAIIYSIGHKPLREWLEKECYISDKKDALNKKIPQFIKDSDKETIYTLLEEFRKGDGYIHHGMNEYVSSSHKMAEDILELVYKKGSYGNIRVKQKKGSIGYIHGRKLIRTADFYVVYEFKNKNITIKPKMQREYYDNVYDIKISGETKLFMIRFKDKRAFWTHNGGLVDMFHGCKGFVNNSSPIQIHNKKSNFANLKSQCCFMLADLTKQGKIGVRSTNEDFKEALVEELEQVKQKDIDKDGKLAIIGKEDMKEKLGRSPDFFDAFMERMLFEMPQGQMSFLSDPDNLTGLY